MIKRKSHPATSIVASLLLPALAALAGCNPTPPPGAEPKPGPAEQPAQQAQKPPTPTPQARPQQAPPAPAVKEIPAPPDVAAPPADAQKTASGLASKVISKGTGAKHPVAESLVEVHYSGWTTDGKMFDSSYKRGRPAQFPLNRVIPGWTEGVQLMVEGEKRRIWIPEDLAYKGRPGAPQGMLVFDVELLRIIR
jgi:FKBP-type peptidyl-prolyl cis-trans isomerase